MLTPSRPLSRGFRPALRAVCLARFPAARLWLKDESLEDSANLSDPDVIAAEIVEDLQAALAQLTLSLPLNRPLGFAHLCRGCRARSIRRNRE